MIDAVGLDGNVVDDPLHPAVRIVLRSEEVVERRYVVVDDVVAFEIKIN